MELQWRCLRCLAVNESRPATPDEAAGPLACAKCGESTPARPEAFRPRGEAARIAACPACGCPDLYRQRDFNRKLGFAIVLLGGILAPWTRYTSILGCLLIDVIIYRLTRDVVLCYHCHAAMRGFPGESEIGEYDLNVSDKYLKIERERGW